MSSARAAAQLLIRLQVTDPAARVYCLTQPRGQDTCLRMANALAGAMKQGDSIPRVLTPSVLPAAADLQAARTALRSPSAPAIVAAGDLLDSPSAVLAATAADLVVLVALQGRTRRSDVDEARRVLAAAGARLAAAVLVR